MSQVLWVLRQLLCQQAAAAAQFSLYINVSRFFLRFSRHTMHYIIPPPLDERRCIAIMAPPKSRRCGRDASKAEMIEVTRQASIAESLSGQERRAAIWKMIVLHICHGHRKSLECDTAEVDRLVRECDGLLQVPPKNTTHSAASQALALVQYTSRHQQVHKLLLKPIHPQQDATGHVYGYTWPAAPGYVKIGYARDSVTKRVKEWAKCHAEARLLFSMEVPYPERMEGLFHAQMSAQRYEIEVCAVCGKRHTEIFKDASTSILSISEQWREVAVVGQLYSSDRRLSQKWVDAIQHNRVRTAADLLEALAMRDASEAPTSTEDIDAHCDVETAPLAVVVDSDPVDKLVTSIACGLDLTS